MIYLFSGENTEERLKAYGEFMKELPKSTEVFNIGKSDFNTAQLESFYSGSGLFFKKCAVVLSGVLEGAGEREDILSKLPEMQESENTFVILEGKLTKTVLDSFRKARASVNVFEKTEKEEERFNSFLLANALGAKDKLNLWIYFRQAIAEGVALEELAGVLFWKAKDMILKKNFSKWSEEDLQKISGKLSYLLPEARRDGRDAEAAFEEYLLEAI